MDSLESPLEDSQIQFTPLLISMVGIASTALAIVAYHFIVTKYCLRSRGTVSQPTQEAQVTTGVEQKVLESIPILAYSSKKGGLFRVDQRECAVCLGDLEEGDMVRLLPSCRHAFHLRCIDKWFVFHSSCPLCRSPPVAEPASIVVSMPPIGADEEGGGGGGGGLEGGVGGDAADSIGPVQSKGLLRHCASLILHTERKPPLLPVALMKRSLSMDHSFKMQQDERRDPSLLSSSSLSSSSSSSSKTAVLTQSSSYRVGSFRLWIVNHHPF